MFPQEHSSYPKELLPSPSAPAPPSCHWRGKVPALGSWPVTTYIVTVPPLSTQGPFPSSALSLTSRSHFLLRCSYRSAAVQLHLLNSLCRPLCFAVCHLLYILLGNKFIVLQSLWSFVPSAPLLLKSLLIEVPGDFLVIKSSGRS